MHVTRSTKFSYCKLSSLWSCFRSKKLDSKNTRVGYGLGYNGCRVWKTWNFGLPFAWPVASDVGCECVPYCKALLLMLYCYFVKPVYTRRLTLNSHICTITARRYLARVAVVS